MVLDRTCQISKERHACVEENFDSKLHLFLSSLMWDVDFQGLHSAYSSPPSGLIAWMADFSAFLFESRSLFHDNWELRYMGFDQLMLPPFSLRDSSIISVTFEAQVCCMYVDCWRYFSPSTSSMVTRLWFSRIFWHKTSSTGLRWNITWYSAK